MRSECMLMEQISYNMLFRWFVGLAKDDPVWATRYCRRIVTGCSIMKSLKHSLLKLTLADKRGLLSKEHFAVDGTLIQAWASHKSFVPKDGSDDQGPRGGGRNAQANWKGKRRSNDTHASTTDPDARLYTKSDKIPTILCYQEHVLMENRSGLVIGAAITPTGWENGSIRCVC
jgi:hypothetical protein